MAEAVIQVTLDPRFTRLLQRQDDLQAFLLMKRVNELDPYDLSAYIRTQAFALNAEVHEAVDETHWKPWSVRPDDEAVVISKTRYTSELADVFIFFMNLMLAGQVTMTDLAKAVEAKQQKNLDRWLNGYNAKTTKCKGCGRSFDDEDVKCYAGKSTAAGPIIAFCDDKGRFIDAEGKPVL